MRNGQGRAANGVLRRMRGQKHDDLDEPLDGKTGKESTVRSDNAERYFSDRIQKILERGPHDFKRERRHCGVIFDFLVVQHLIIECKSACRAAAFTSALDK